jgi:hypothetical protein
VLLKSRGCGGDERNVDGVVPAVDDRHRRRDARD